MWKLIANFVVEIKGEKRFVGVNWQIVRGLYVRALEYLQEKQQQEVRIFLSKTQTN